MYSFKDCPSIHYTKLQAFFESVKRGVDCRSLRNLNGRGFKLCNPINTTITKPHSFHFNARRKTLFKNLAVVQFFFTQCLLSKTIYHFYRGAPCRRDVLVFVLYGYTVNINQDFFFNSGSQSQISIDNY